MKVVRIQRKDQSKTQTIGICNVFDDNKRHKLSCLSLERGNNENKPNISCIPQGLYRVVLEYSDKFNRDLYEIKGVRNRSECKFHSANYWFQLEGCISLGSDLGDINNDGYSDILNSKKTMKKFAKALDYDNEFLLIIYNGF